MMKGSSRGETSSTLSDVVMMEERGSGEESGENQDLVLLQGMAAGEVEEEEEVASEEDQCMEETLEGKDIPQSGEAEA